MSATNKLSSPNPIVITVICYVYDTYDSVTEGMKRKGLGSILIKGGKGMTLYFVDSTGKRSMITLPSAIHSFLTSFWRSV